MRAVIVMIALAALCVAPLAVSAGGKPEFAKMDTDGDGQLTAAEFDAFIEADPELGIAKGAFAEMDVDKDGIVTVSEYAAWMPMEKKAPEADEAEEAVE